MLKSFLASVAFFAASAVAQTPPVTITQPLLAFTWYTCQNQIIAWVSPAQETIGTIWLDSGPSTLLQKFVQVASNVPTAPLKFEWVPPSTIPTGNYSLELGTAPNIAYAGPFNIINNGTQCGGSPASSGSPAPAPSAASSGAPSNAPSSAPAPAPSGASSASSGAATVPSAASAASQAASPAAGTTAASSPSSTPSSAVRPSNAGSMALVAALSLIAAVAALL